MADEYLGEHLREIGEALLNLDETDPLKILGSPDDKKVRSCMILFKYADGTTDCKFDKVLKKFYSGKEDKKSLMLLNMKEKQVK